MIHSITITDFQAHHRLQVDLSPSVTTIVGASDVGKSATVRALRWLATNKPGGDAFIRDGATDAMVEVHVDSHTLLRSKGKGGNRYYLGGQELVSFGANVPEPVAKVLNVADINFQGQHDSPFWFSETGGAVSQRLNELINLSSIDNALSYLGSELRAAEGLVSATETRLASAKETRDGLRFAVDMAAEWNTLEETGRTVTVGGALVGLLADEVETAARCRETVERASAFATDAQNVVQMGEVLREGGHRAGVLASLVGSALKSASVLSLPIPPLEKVERKWERLAETIKKRDTLHGVLVSARAQTLVVYNATEAAGTRESELRAALRELGACPVCGRTKTP